MGSRKSAKGHFPISEVNRFLTEPDIHKCIVIYYNKYAQNAEIQGSIIMNNNTVPPSIPDARMSITARAARNTPPESSGEKKKSCEGENIVDGIQDLAVAPEVMERIYTLSEVGTTIIQTGSDIIAESGMKGKIGIAAGAGTAISGVFFAIKGAKDLKDAIEKKDAMAGLGAAGELGLAGSAAISTAQMLTTLTGTSRYINPAVATLINSPVAVSIGNSLGLIFASTELLAGGKLLHEGFMHKNKEKIILGALNLGIGASAAALFTVGGVIPAVALGALSLAELIAFGAEKVSDKLRKIHQEQEQKLKAETMEKVMKESHPLEPNRVEDSLLNTD